MGNAHLCAYVCVPIYTHIHRTQRFNVEFASYCHPATMTKEEITVLSLTYSSNTMSVTIIYPFTYIYIHTCYRKEVSYIKNWQPCKVLNTYLFNILLRLLKKIILAILYFHKVYAIMLSNLHWSSKQRNPNPTNFNGL